MKILNFKKSVWVPLSCKPYQHWVLPTKQGILLFWLLFIMTGIFVFTRTFLLLVGLIIFFYIYWNLSCLFWWIIFSHSFYIYLLVYLSFSYWLIRTTYILKYKLYHFALIVVLSILWCFKIYIVLQFYSKNKSFLLLIVLQVSILL